MTYTVGGLINGGRSDYDFSKWQITSVISVTEVLGALAVVGFTFRDRNYSFQRLAPLLLLSFALLLMLNFFARPELSIISYFFSAIIVLGLHALSENYFRSRITNTKIRASVLSFVTLCDSVMISIGYLSFGFLLEWTTSPRAIGIAMIFPLLGAVCAQVSLRRRRRSEFVYELRLNC